MVSIRQEENENLCQKCEASDQEITKAREEVEGLRQRTKAHELESNNMKQTVGLLQDEICAQSLQIEKCIAFSCRLVRISPLLPWNADTKHH